MECKSLLYDPTYRMACFLKWVLPPSGWTSDLKQHQLTRGSEGNWHFQIGDLTAAWRISLLWNYVPPQTSLTRRVGGMSMSLSAFFVAYTLGSMRGASPKTLHPATANSLLPGYLPILYIPYPLLPWHVITVLLWNGKQVQVVGLESLLDLPHVLPSYSEDVTRLQSVFVCTC